MAQLQKITPFLWFDSEAEEAAKLYTSVFGNSKILGTTKYAEAGKEVHGRKPGSVMTVEFELEGQRFTALNGGPLFQFNESISFQVHCDTQQEVDHFWSKLRAPDNEGQCGWMKDRFGVSWQITPKILAELLQDPDRQKAERAFAAMMKMKKLDIAELKRAAGG